MSMNEINIVKLWEKWIFYNDVLKGSAHFPWLDSLHLLKENTPHSLENSVLRNLEC